MCVCVCACISSTGADSAKLLGTLMFSILIVDSFWQILETLFCVVTELMYESSTRSTDIVTTIYMSP